MLKFSQIIHLFSVHIFPIFFYNEIFKKNSMAITIAETMYALPLIKAYNVHCTPIAYGYDIANGGSRRLVREIREEPFIYALDFKSIDKLVPAWLIDMAVFVL